MLKLGVENTNSKQQEANRSVLLVPGLSRNLLSSSTALANGVETIISSFPRLLAKKRRRLPADTSLYFLNAVFPKPPELTD